VARLVATTTGQTEEPKNRRGRGSVFTKGKTPPPALVALNILVETGRVSVRWEDKNLVKGMRKEVKGANKSGGTSAV